MFVPWTRVDRQRGTTWTEARALVHRAPLHYLIVKAQADPLCPWEFPGGRLGPRASAENLLRRLCRASLGIELDQLVSQPPFSHGFGTHSVTYRYYLCPVLRDEAMPLGYAELRWVPAPQLCEYDFDAPSRQVVDRVLATHRSSRS